MTDSLIPGGRRNKNRLYATVGLLLAIAAGGLLYLSLKPAEDQKPAPSPPKSDSGRSTALVEEPELAIPEEDSEAQETKPEKKARAARERDRWDCRGNLDPAQAGKIMRENSQIVRTCYERQLKVNQLLQGAVSLTLRVGANGKVTGTRIAGDIQDAGFRNCVRNAASGWIFPRPTSDSCAVIQQPFDLAPRTP